MSSSQWRRFYGVGTKKGNRQTHADIATSGSGQVWEMEIFMFKEFLNMYVAVDFSRFLSIRQCFCIN